MKTKLILFLMFLCCSFAWVDAATPSAGAYPVEGKTYYLYALQKDKSRSYLYNDNGTLKVFNGSKSDTNNYKWTVTKSGSNYIIHNVAGQYISIAGWSLSLSNSSSKALDLGKNVTDPACVSLYEDDPSYGDTYYVAPKESGGFVDNLFFESYGSDDNYSSNFVFEEVLSAHSLNDNAYYWIYCDNDSKQYLYDNSGLKVANVSSLTDNHYVWKCIVSEGKYNFQNVGTSKYLAHKSVQASAYNFTISTSGVYHDGCATIYSDAASKYMGMSSSGGFDQANGHTFDKVTTDYSFDWRFVPLRIVTFNKDTGTELKKIYTDGNIKASDLEDYYNYSIGGVAKTKDEVVSAINAVTDDNLVIVCSYKLGATISTKAEIDQTKVYAISMKREKGNVQWMYAKNYDATSKTFFSTTATNTFDDNNLWAFVSVDNGESYYLYNVGQRRFVMSKMGGTHFMDGKFTIRPVTIYAHGNNNPSYPLGFKDGNYVFNENGGNLIVDNWTSADDGNRFSIQPLSGYVFDPTSARAAINAMSDNIPFHTSPAPSAGSFDEATTWYNISMRPLDGNGGYFAYVPADYNYESPTNIPLGTTTGAKENSDNYRWCITGSVENGYRLFNKAAGASKVFVFDGGGKIKDYSGNETSSLFYLASSNVQNGIDAPTFVFKNTNNRPNRQSNTIASWSNSDCGSEFGFEIDEAYDANNFYYIEYVQTVKPFMDEELCSQYFHLTSDKQKQNIWNVPARYSDGVEHAYYSHEDVTAMRAAVEAYAKKPIGTLGVRLKNANTGKYVSYGQPTWNGEGLICDETISVAESDLTSVLQFIPASATTYYIYMPTKGKYVGQQSAGNTSFPLVDEGSRVQFTISMTNTPGVISICNADSYVNSNFEGYLHSAGWAKPGVVNWQASNPSSYWTIEDAETISLDMISPVGVTDGEDVYMTYVNRLGLPLNAPENASVWTISTQNDERARASEVDSKDIPADGAVILKAEKGSTIHMNIKSSTTETLDGNILIPGDGSTNVAAGNYMLAYNSTDDIAKFYVIGASGFVVPANKAYLPPLASGVKALNLFFEDDEDATAIANVNVNGNADNAAIYNIAGQRISKLQKGINIVNGKKVLY